MAIFDFLTKHINTSYRKCNKELWNIFSTKVSLQEITIYIYNMLIFQNRNKIETWMSIKNNEESLPNLLNKILKEAETYKPNHTSLIQLSMHILKL